MIKLCPITIPLSSDEKIFSSSDAFKKTLYFFDSLKKYVKHSASQSKHFKLRVIIFISQT